MKTLLICSGGLDSVTLAYKTVQEHTLKKLISFNYGQRHQKELEFAALCAQDLGVEHQIIDISGVGAVLSGSALTDNVDVPDGHYAEESMKQTIVPNRNAIMLTIAYGIACADGIKAVGTAVHGGDHFIYPDCRPSFIKAFEDMQNFALDDISRIRMYAPFLELSKAQIVEEGARLGVPFENTWSCYKGGDIHCGRCGTCVERQEAFDLANIKDPTVYTDSKFWRNSVKKEQQRRAG